MTQRNLEWKARLWDWDEAHRIATRLSGTPARVLLQTDTYFFAANGRLKLREISDSAEPEPLVQLIAYHRPDSSDARESFYRIVSLHEGAATKALLSESLGVRAVVAKARSLYLVGKTRIHLDRVDGLGDFIEMEYVFGPRDSDDFAAKHELFELKNAFVVVIGEQIQTSYGDLLPPDA